MFDQVIVGGGILGCSIAYHLAKASSARVLVLERNELASAASSRAAGLILQATTKPANAPLVQTTLRTIPALEAELEDIIGFHAVGSLRIAGLPARVSELQRVAETAGHRGIPVERLDRARVESIVPWLRLSRDCETLFMPTDGYVDPYLLSMGYARAARARGVVFRPRTAVTGITVERGRVIGVEVGGQRIAASTVIDAAGAWAAVVSAMAGYALPMAPVRSHYWITEPQPEFGTDHPVTILADAAAYTRPETGGLVLGIQEQHSKSFDARDLPDDPAAFSPTVGEEHWDILAASADSVAAFFPDIMTARFHRYIAGLSAYTPDGGILLGALPGISGFLVATGCCGSGVALSGGIGAAVGDLALGNTPRYELSPFDPGRFGSVDPHDRAFRERCVAARAAKAHRPPENAQPD